VGTSGFSEPPIRIYLLAQNRLVREVLVRLFRKRTDIAVAGVSSDSIVALEELQVIPCDVLLLDSAELLQMIGDRRKLAEGLEEFRIVLFGAEEEPECFLRAVRMGVLGYLPKDASWAQIVGAVRNVMQGEAICTPKLCKFLFETVSKEVHASTETEEQGGHLVNGLTCRQRQLMGLVAKGLTNKEIAANLRLSEFTVKNHIRRVMTHLGAKSRHEAVDVIRTGGFSLNG
jgi:DNA-binding NarL/FixJ family response regulator